MFCPDCGCEITDNVAFCPNCGSAIQVEKKEANASIETEAKKKRLIMRILFVVLIITFAISLFRFFSIKSTISRQWKGNSKNTLYTKIVFYRDGSYKNYSEVGNIEMEIHGTWEMDSDKSIETTWDTALAYENGKFSKRVSVGSSYTYRYGKQGKTTEMYWFFENGTLFFGGDEYVPSNVLFWILDRYGIMLVSGVLLFLLVVRAILIRKRENERA